MGLELTNAEVAQLLGGGPAPGMTASASATGKTSTPVTPEDVSAMVAHTVEGAKAYGIDAGALGLTNDEIARVTGIKLPPPGDSVLAPGQPPSAQVSINSTLAQPAQGPLVIPDQLVIGPDGRISAGTQQNPSPRPSAILDNLADAGKRFLANPAEGVIEFGKGLVSDVVDGASGLADLLIHAPEQIDANMRVNELMRQVQLDPNNIQARTELKAVRDRADVLNAQASDDAWKAAVGATLFLPFGGPIKIASGIAGKMGLTAVADGLMESLAAKGIKGVATRLVDRAGKGAVVGGTYGYFASKGNVEAAKNSALLMGGIFGAGPALAAPIKSVFGTAATGTRKAVNMFNQIPAVAATRASLYNGPVGRIWDHIATRTETVFEQSGLGNLLNEMHLARTEFTRLAGGWDAGMRRNLEGLGQEDMSTVAALLERRTTPAELAQTLGTEQASILSRAAASEQRRLKGVGRMLQAWGVPMHNSETGELYNFVMRDNFFPHIMVNVETLADDITLRTKSIAAIAAKTGKNPAEAAQHFEQWLERARTEAPLEATTGNIGRATLEARLYGLPGYSVDTRNVLSLYYQRAARQLAFHRRLGRHVVDPNAPPGNNDAQAALTTPPDPTLPIPPPSDIPIAPTAEAPAFKPGDKVTIQGAKGPINGKIAKMPMSNGLMRVHVGEPGAKGAKVLTVTPSKVQMRPENVKPLVAEAMVPQTVAEAVKSSGGRVKSAPRTAEAAGIKKGSIVYMGANDRPARITGTAPKYFEAEYTDTGTKIRIPKSSANLRKQALGPVLPPFKQGDSVLFEGKPYTVVSQAGDRVRVRDPKSGQVQGFFRKDIIDAADVDKKFTMGEYSPKQPWEMSKEEFARELNGILTATGQTRARVTFKDLPPDHAAWAAYEKGDWPAFSREMGFGDDEIRDFRRFIELAGGGKDGAPHYDPLDPWHGDLYDWWQKQKPAGNVTMEGAVSGAAGSVEATGGEMTIAQLRKSLKEQGYDPKEIGKIVKEITEARKASKKAA